jgi:2,4-dienoyl-CoA reductase (NADPH2)
MAEFLAHDPHHKPTSLDIPAFLAEWGVDTQYKKPGSLKPKLGEKSYREIYLLQRKTTKHGKDLGKTTGWIHRQSLIDKGIIMIGGVEYKEITDQGLIISTNGKDELLKVDNVIMCAGQESENTLYQNFKVQTSKPCHIIGGAEMAMEIDAKRAIDQGVRLAYQI